MSLAFDIRGQVGDLSIQAASRVDVSGVTVLFGPSGTGKSTLLRMIAGLYPSDGDIRFGDQDWQLASAWSLPVWERSLGMLFQQPTLFRHLTVRGNLDYVYKRRPGEADLQAIIDETGIRPLLDRHVRFLSGGEAQRVALARALAGSPKLLLLDEPLSAVDLPQRENLLALVKQVSRRVPVIYVTHSLEELLLLADQVWLMEAGRLVFQGPVATALGQLHNPLAQRSDAASLLEGQRGAFDSADHLQRVYVGEADFLVPLAEPLQGEGSVRLRIAARDVSLCRSLPEQSSILNIFPVRVEGVMATGPGQHLVQLSLQSQPLLARLSSRSVRELRIAPGETLFAQVKAVALV